MKRFEVIKQRCDGGVVNTLKPIMCKLHPLRPVWARELCKSCYNKWLINNNPEYAKKQKENVKKWINCHKEQSKNHKKNWVLKQDPLYNRIKTLRKYGMTIEDYDNMLKKQNGVCFICKNTPKKGKHLHVDHDHYTGKVRGLLCFRCNFGLSFFKENKDIIKNLFDYFHN